ncbi:hypothetical protein BOSEA31B_14207 [Hyphomicrobiales bacterium]|nr:hypothetical protein BOSEA31B_14207 [Hyphomicrobiales bacterium]CAH1699984.1 hypothetical protein BOSEA1005_13037 [Hyphomicrobiales bacterium]CAI0343741.1 hypothetical protein BO1005MUT1_290077 [Hyphomicrobiales bacterium]
MSPAMPVLWDRAASPLRIVLFGYAIFANINEIGRIACVLRISCICEHIFSHMRNDPTLVA